MKNHRRRVRARVERRRRERQAGKRGKPVRLMTTPTDKFYDDCPICRAMRDTGLAGDGHGIVEMTAEQHAAYQKRLAEIVAEEGWPEDAQFMTGDEMFRQLELADATLRAQGYSADIDAMTDDEALEYFQRLSDQVREQGRAEALAIRTSSGGAN